MTDISQSKEYFLGGWRLVDGRMVRVNTEVRFRCQVRLSLSVSATRARRWRDGVCLGALASRNSN